MNHGSRDIAIIGMACVLPGAPDMQRCWENILHKVNVIGDAPAEWEADLVFEENTIPFASGIMPNAGGIGHCSNRNP